MSASTLVISLEVALGIAGLVLLWQLVLRPIAAQTTVPTRLERWNIPVTEFLRFLLVVVAGGFLGSLAGTLLTALHPTSLNAKAMVLTASTQVGWIAVIFAYQFFVTRAPRSTLRLHLRDVTSGIATLCIALPLIQLVSFPWRLLLDWVGLPPEKQELVDMFINVRSPALLLLMIVLATVTAPLAEELIFRAGLFRFAHQRLPRWAALLAPACVFAAMHNNLASFVPLAVLGIVFSLAYERTGRIATAIVAHSLFNLLAVLQVFAGVGV